MKTIRAYLCYTCFSWLKPLYSSLNKKMNLSVKENNIDEGKTENNTSGEIIVLTRQFQQIFDNYLHDILDIETSDYFKAKNEIERINKLLSTSSSMINNIDEGNFLIDYYCLYTDITYILFTI